MEKGRPFPQLYKSGSAGLKSGKGQIPIDRLGTKHQCIFEEGTIEVVPAKNEVNEEEIRYVESNYEVEAGLKYFADCRLTRKGENLTRLRMKIGTERGRELPAEAAEMVWQVWRECLIISRCSAKVRFDFNVN